MFLLLRHRTESAIFALAYSSAILAVVIGFILWERRYRRSWQQFRARNWQRVAGKFDEGEIVTMRKGRSTAIAGYQVWLGYEYEGDEEEGGLDCTPKVRHEVKGPATLNGGEQCWCPDKSIPVN